MAHFAEVENGIVTRVLVVPDEQQHRGQEYLATELGLGGTWIQTSYNTIAGTHTGGGTPLRGNYAGIGYTYDSEKDAFYAPKPFASWTLNNTTFVWEAPTPMPTDGKLYSWDEPTTSWKEVENV